MQFTASAPLQPQWHHLVLNRRGNTPSQWELWYDGHRLPPYQVVGYDSLLTGSLGNSAANFIDCWGCQLNGLNFNTAFGWQGGLAHLRKYHRALSSAQVQAHYAAGACGGGPLPGAADSLLLWLPLTQPSDTLADLSGRNAPALLGGTPPAYGWDTTLSDACILQENVCLCQPDTILVAANAYRYGYQGSEKSDEIGDDHFTTFYREGDARIGRWWSVDPKASELPPGSPYTLNENNPIRWNDPKGDCPWCPFIAGAVVDYTVQVGFNLAEGAGTYDAFIGKVDFMDVGVAGIQAYVPGSRLLTVPGKLGAVALTEATKQMVNIGENLPNPMFEEFNPTVVAVNTFIDQKLGQTIETALKKLSNEASTYVNEMTSTVMESKVLNTAQKRSVLENSNIGTNTVIAATAEASAETMPSYAVNTAQKVTSDAMAPNSAGNFATGAFDFNGKSNSGDSGAMKLQNFMNASDNPNAKPKK